MMMMTTMANYLPPFDAPLLPEPVAVLQTTVVPSFVLQKKKQSQWKLLPLVHRVQMNMLMWMHPVHYQNHGHPLMMTVIDVL